MRTKESERQRAKVHREKLKQNPKKYSLFKEKDSKRQKLYRDLQKQKILDGFISPAILKVKREREASRKRVYRQKLKEKKINQEKEVKQETTVFKSPQALGRALKKLKNVLPKCPEKQKEVVKKLASYVVPELKDPNKNSVRKSTKLDQNLVEQVQQFYFRDDISRQAPGKRDVISVKTKEGKIKLQKRHMSMAIREAYAFFLEENPDSGIKLTKFYELRPKNILLSSDMPHNVCVCKYHANFNYLLESVHKEIKQFPKSSKELLSVLCCSIDDSNCMNGLCSNCENDMEYGLIPLSVIQNDVLELEITWKSWHNSFGRPQVLEIKGSLSAALSSLQESLGQFKIHQYIKVVQEKKFEKLKNEISDEKAVLQVDFAENYSCISQDEIQSAHWSHQQVTVFTAVAWVSSNCHSFAVVSDNLNHDKICVWFFLKMIIQWLRSCYSALKQVDIFSDGCAAQFKNKFTLTNL